MTPPTHPMHQPIRLHAAALLALTLALALPGAAALAQTPGAPKPRIEKAADLPRFSYPVTGKLEALVRAEPGAEAAFASLAAALRRDTE